MNLEWSEKILAAKIKTTSDRKILTKVVSILKKIQFVRGAIFSSLPQLV